MTTAPWLCRRWIGKRRCGARMRIQPDRTYRCPRCEPVEPQTDSQPTT